MPDEIYDPDIMTRHGRPGYRPGEPMRCQPSRAEQAGTEPRRAPHTNDGRVIFDDLHAAWSAIEELHAAGAPTLEPYPCERSKTGHWHIRPAPHAPRAGTGQDESDPPRG